MKSQRLKIISAFTPYVAVLVGMYVLHNAWVAIGLYHLGLIVFISTGDKNSLVKTGCGGWNAAMAAAGVAMSVMIFPVIYFLWGCMRLEGEPLGLVLAGFGLHGRSWLIFMVYFSTVQPVLEELYWREHLKCDKNFLSWREFAFVGYHVLVLAWFVKWFWLVIAFVVLAGAGYVWRRLSRELEGLIVPLLSHIAGDVSIVVAVHVLMRN